MMPQETFSLIESIMTEKQYSDIHLSVGIRPQIRNYSGDMQDILDREWKSLEILELWTLEGILSIVLSPDDIFTFKKEFELDTSYTSKDGTRYRVNCYNETHGPALAFRRINKEIPSLESLWFWDTMKEICRKSKGLILMTGPTWSGKSTNIASMIEYINTHFKRHIITIEDPIEFLFENKESIIHQREIGLHTKSFPHALKSCLREDPNIIVVWEMRDPETIKAALTLAETGHLVFSTLHTNDTAQSIDRIVDVFPAVQQDQIRMQLAMSLVGIIAQRLLPVKDKDAKVAAREVLLSNDAVRNLILTGKTHQLYSVIEIGQKEGMILMDQYLSILYKKGLITLEVFQNSVRDKENITILLQ